MGHYYSEMVSDNEIEVERTRKEKWKQNSLAFLKKEIKEKGLEDVLFEILKIVGPNGYGNRAGWYDGPH